MKLSCAITCIVEGFVFRSEFHRGIICHAKRVVWQNRLLLDVTCCAYEIVALNDMICVVTSIVNQLRIRKAFG